MINLNALFITTAASASLKVGACQLLRTRSMPSRPTASWSQIRAAISYLEMIQNSMRLSWSRDEFNRQLREIMLDIHNSRVEHGSEHEACVNYLKWANFAGFIQVADARRAWRDEREQDAELRPVRCIYANISKPLFRQILNGIAGWLGQQ